MQLALEVKYPPVRHLDARERRTGIHRRPPSDQPCRVLTGPLRPADGFPALPGGALLPRLLRVLRHAPAATADGAPAPNPPTGLGGHRRDASHVHSYAGRQGRRPAVPRGHRRALPQHGTRPRPPDGKTSGRDGPEQQPGPSIPTAHSRQFRGCCPVSGLQPLVSVSLRLSTSLPHPARWRRTVARWSRAACRPTPHLRRQCCPPASPGRYGGRGRGLSPRPVIWRLVAQCRVGRGPEDRRSRLTAAFAGNTGEPAGG